MRKFFLFSLSFLLTACSFLDPIQKKLGLIDEEPNPLSVREGQDLTLPPSFDQLPQPQTKSETPRQTSSQEGLADGEKKLLEKAKTNQA